MVNTTVGTFSTVININQHTPPMTKHQADRKAILPSRGALQKVVLEQT